MKFTSRILPLAFVLLAVHINLSHQKSQTYGQSCSSSARCDPRSGTVDCNLDSMRCDCKDPATMVYDEKSGECVSVEGASCFMKPLRNRSVRNCLAGTVCTPVSSKSIFGLCRATVANFEQNDMELFAESSSSSSSSIPPVEDNSSTPLAEDDNSSTPLAEDDNSSTPLAEDDNSSTPLAEDDNSSTPLAEDNNSSTPLAEDDNSSTPLAEDNNSSTPLAEDNNSSTPVAEDNSTPPAEDNSTPPAEDNSTPPAEDNSTPAEDNSTPPAEDNSTPLAGDNSTPTPAKEVGDECAAATECIANADCTESEGKSTCQCQAEALPQEGGSKCARKIGQDCPSNDYQDCVANSHCMEGKCMCHEPNMEKDGACGVIVEQVCDADTPCAVENSACMGEHFEDYKNGTCQCTDSLTVTEDKKGCNSAVTNAINFTLFILLVSSSYAISKFNH